MHYCLFERRYRIEPLLAKGAYVDVRLASGNTPLMGLIRVKDRPDKYELIRLFIKFNSDLSIKNKEGKTAIDLVNESDDDNIKQIFSELGLIAKPSYGIKMQ